jgi:pimeloyl-ACP methyl ester carboxylesterase
MDFYTDFKEGFMRSSFGSLCFRHHKGTGKTLILLHGIGATTQSWQKFVKYLPDNMDVYVIDLLGHGKSDKPDIDYTVGIQAKAIEEFVNAEEVKEPFVMGHSYGGWVAITYAKSGSIKGLVLEDSLGLKEYFDEIKNRGIDGYKKKMLDNLVLMNNNDKNAMESTLNEEFTASQVTSEFLKQINVPTLIIWGSEDSIINVGYAAIFNKGLEESRLEIIDGADHVPHYSKPKETADAMIKFIESK